MNRSADMRPDGRDRVGEMLVRFCVAVMVAGSIVKFVHPAAPAAYMAYLGYEHDALFVVAALELLSAGAFLLSATRSFGLLLVSAYFGGAIAAHLASHPFSGGGPYLAFAAHHHYLGALPAMLVLASAWIGVYLRHPESRWSVNDANTAERRSRSNAGRVAAPRLNQNA